MDAQINTTTTLTSETTDTRSYICLTRKPQEGSDTILIGDIELTVVEIKGKQVRLGIRADRSVPIERKERYQKRLS